MNVQFDKASTGKTIYLLGRDNAKKRNGVNPLLLGKITKVSPQKVTIITDSGRVLTLSHAGSGNCSFNYDIFLSVEDYQAQKAKDKIREQFEHHNKDNVDTDTTLKIAELLGIKIAVPLEGTAL